MPSSNHGRTPGNLTEVLCGFTQYPRQDQYSTSTRPWPLSCKSFPIHHTVGATYLQTPTASYTKPQKMTWTEYFWYEQCPEKQRWSAEGTRRTVVSRIVVDRHTNRIITELYAIFLSPYTWLLEFTSKEDKSPNNKSLTHLLFIIILSPLDAMLPLLLKMDAAYTTQKLASKHWRVEWNLKCFDVKNVMKCTCIVTITVL
jgi:hypothetical protein